MLDRPAVDEGGAFVCEALGSVPLIAPAPREPPNLSGLCHIGHMDGVDATGIGPEALDLSTVLEHPLSCKWTKQKQLQVSEGEREAARWALLPARCQVPGWEVLGTGR